jgi:hypothetical protein
MYTSARIYGKVRDSGDDGAPIQKARILVFSSKNIGLKWKEDTGPGFPSWCAEGTPVAEVYSAADGEYYVNEGLEPGTYVVVCDAFIFTDTTIATVDLTAGEGREVNFKVPIGFNVIPCVSTEDGRTVHTFQVKAGTPVLLRADHAQSPKELDLIWHRDHLKLLRSDPSVPNEVLVSTVDLVGHISVRATLRERHSASVEGAADFTVLETPVQPISGTVGVNLRRSASHPTPDQALWVAIRTHTRAISFSGDGAHGSGYKAFIDRVLCRGKEIPHDTRLKREINELGTHVQGVAAYELLKTATEVFLLLQCGVKIDDHDKRLFDPNEEGGRLGLGEPISLEEVSRRLREYLGDGRLPYIDRVILAAFPGITTGPVHCSGILTSRADCPCLLELIWSYWHEEGMLVQSINAVSRRFQNVRGPGDRDPLAHLEIDPLRPLNNLLWGHVQGEWNRLTVKRRAYEYDHHYGLTLYGKAVPAFRPADSRSKFLEGFHNLLYVCSVFFKEDNDTTVIADGYPLLNALKEVHLLLAQGAHNQFGDLPWTARVEMLIQEWLLARPEMRDFLQSRVMVPYKEGWMPQVDTMKTLQGWSDVTVTHFRDLGVYGEQLLLSIRYSDWIGINDEDFAKNWARYWRPEIQGYLHAYRAATGVDLTNPDTVDSTMPSVHLQKRLASQRSR